MTSPEYERGRVDAILAEHGAHLTRINGSIERFAAAVEALGLTLQRTADAATADRDTARATAAALEAANKARRDASESHWTPVSRAIAVLGSVAALVTLAGYLVYLARG